MNESLKNNEEKSPSMDQILQSIRGVISNKSEISTDATTEEILELTEIVNPDGTSISEIIEEDNDILNYIDNTIGVDKDKNDIGKEEKNQKNSENKINENQQIDTKAEKNIIHNQNDKKIFDESLKLKNRLISDEAASASSEALKFLVKTVSRPISDGLAFRSGNTVEDLVIELIKPYLSKWLDSNLPNIVKHLVEKEIQKLIPKDED